MEKQYWNSFPCSHY